MPFLQGQVTCDVEAIMPGNANLAAHCNPQGRVISLFQLLYQDNHYDLMMPRDMIALTINALKKYAVFFKVTLEDATHDALPVDPEKMEARIKKSIEEGIPVIHPATSGKCLPQELNLDKLGAISYEKGCYTGQEIIARIHYRGKTKSSLYHATIFTDSTPQPGDTIKSPRECGMIIESCLISDNDYHALIVLDDADLNNKTLFISSNKDTLTVLPGI